LAQALPLSQAEIVIAKRAVLVVRVMAFLTNVLAIALLRLELALGHAFLSYPIGRNFYHRIQGDMYNIAGFDAGGPSALNMANGGVWPGHAFPETHGLCGNNVLNGETMLEESLMAPVPIQATFLEGDIVEFEVAVTAHHKGYYEFRICDQAVNQTNFPSRTAAQACFDQHLLVRAEPRADCQPNDEDPDCQPIDERYPERWYLPESGWGLAATYPSPPLYPNSAGDVHRMRYKLPENLNCEHCTMQLYWPCSNSCIPNQGFWDYFGQIENEGWDEAAVFDFDMLHNDYQQCEHRCCGGNNGYAQEFWNCADITILPSGSATTAAGTTTAQVTSPVTTPAATTTAGPSTTGAAGECANLCLKTNLTATTCADHGTEASCEGSFVSIGGGAASIPCKWLSCACVADGSGLLACPECM